MTPASLWHKTRTSARFHPTTKRLRMTIQSTLIASVALSVFTLSPVEAATWNAVSLGFAPDTATAPYKYSAASFSDDQSVPFDSAKGPTSFVLSNKPNISATPTAEGESRNTITFTGFSGGAFNGIKPPVVDTISRTIDVSSIFFEAMVGEYDCSFCDPRFPAPVLVWRGQIGGLFGPTTPVPYAQNADGTFTATWIATTDPLAFFSPFGTSPIYFTFAAQVPEPTPAAMLAVGLAILFGRRRFRITERNCNQAFEPPPALLIAAETGCACAPVRI